MEKRSDNIQCDGTLYVVRPGDTFFIIARRFGVSLEDLIAANPQIPDPANIFPGQIICVPVEVQCPREVEGFIYTVLPGETLSEIARRFNVTVDQILAVNPQITDPNLIFAGQRICIPRPGVRFPCCAILTPVPQTDLSPLALGSVLIQEAPNGRYALTFTAVGLPEPSFFGDFDRYIGTVRIEGLNLSFSSILGRTPIEDQPETWCGTRIIPDNPQSPENTLVIRPFNFQTGISGSPLLRGFVGNCR